MKPLVSVITPTWQRRGPLIDKCVPSVYGQTYPRVEHVIVSDGPDRIVAEALAEDLWHRPRASRPLVFDQLPGHVDHGPVDYGSRARNRGLELATGEYVAYLDDDNAYRPDHLQVLVDALDANPDADFAYSRMLVHSRMGDPGTYEVGSEPPDYGQIDTSLIVHRAGLPQRCGLWPLPDELVDDKHAPDWGVVQRWLDAGAKWTFVPQVTLDYRVA